MGINRIGGKAHQSMLRASSSDFGINLPAQG